MKRLYKTLAVMMLAAGVVNCSNNDPTISGGGDLPVRFACPQGDNQVSYAGRLSSDETWTADKTYLVSDLNTAGKNLTIQAGTVVCFSNGGLVVSDGSALKVLGQNNKHVVFTSIDQEDYWSGVKFATGFSSATTLQFVDFYNASKSGGGAAIQTDASTTSPALDLQQVRFFSLYGKGLQIRHEAGFSAQTHVLLYNYAAENRDPSTQYTLLEADAIAAGTFSSENIEIGLTVPAKVRYVDIYNAFIHKSVTWKKLNLPYRLHTMQTITGPGAPTLTINAGATVQVADALYVGDRTAEKGNLVVAGTAAQPVLFTSTAAQPKAGDWGGIIFPPTQFSTDISKIEYAKFEYGGASVELTSNCNDRDSKIGGEVVFIQPGKTDKDNLYYGPKITNSTFTVSQGQGIRFHCAELSGCLANDYSDKSLGNSFVGFSTPPGVYAPVCK